MQITEIYVTVRTFLQHLLRFILGANRMCSINPDNVITFDEMYRHLIKKMYIVCRFIKKNLYFK